MPKITFIVGLPASGKTTFGRKLCVPFFEDSTCIPEGMEGNFAIDSPHFCNAVALQNAQKSATLLYPTYSHELIFFENNPTQCLINSRKRGDKKVNSFIRRATIDYFPPKDAKPVWQDNNS